MMYDMSHNTQQAQTHSPINIIPTFSEIKKDDDSRIMTLQDAHRSDENKNRLSRELKKNIRRNIHDREYLLSVLGQMTAEELIELEAFIWKEALQYCNNEFHTTLARTYITEHLEPTANYHRRQMCGEPIDACRANYCIQSNPACASRKLTEHILAITAVFDRRRDRDDNLQQSLSRFLKHMIQKHELFGAILTDENGMPYAAVTDMDQNRNDQSQFIRLFYMHLMKYLKNEKNDFSYGYDLPVQVVVQKFQTEKQKLAISLLSMKELNFDVVLFQMTLGIQRIFMEYNTSEVS